ncbi:hypothetical protein ACA910_001088 [Epithemia clementina (nom. ined.)]
MATPKHVPEDVVGDDPMLEPINSAEAPIALEEENDSMDRSRNRRKPTPEDPGDMIAKLTLGESSFASQTDPSGVAISNGKGAAETDAGEPEDGMMAEDIERSDSLDVQAPQPRPDGVANTVSSVAAVVHNSDDQPLRHPQRQPALDNGIRNKDPSAVSATAAAQSAGPRSPSRTLQHQKSSEPNNSASEVIQRHQKNAALHLQQKQQSHQPGAHVEQAGRKRNSDPMDQLVDQRRGGDGQMQILSESGGSKGDEEFEEDEDDEEESSEMSPSDEDGSWIAWFCSLRGNEFFCEVDEDYIQDDFNLTGLNTMVPYYDYALDMVLDVEMPMEDSLTEEQQEIVESAAEMLYGLIHARYIVTNRGMHSMYEKYRTAAFGRCPQVFCQGQPVLPVGLSDLPRNYTVNVFCPRCQGLFFPRSTRQANIDGAYFGTTFPHLYLMTHPDMVPSRPSQTYVPRVYGFRINQQSSYYRNREVERAREQQGDAQSRQSRRSRRHGRR